MKNVNINKNGSELKVFEYGGYGSYSNYFGYNTGLTYQLGNVVSMEDVENIEEEANCRGCFAGSFSNIDPKIEGSSGYYFYNSHGGSIEERGFIVSFSSEKAEKFLEEWTLESTEEYEVEQFNKDYETNFSTRKECNKYAEELKRKQLKRKQREELERKEAVRGFGLANHIDLSFLL